MGEPAAGVNATSVLDAFFASYYLRRPVTATFSGVHAHDRELPDWSPDGLDATADEMRALREALASATSSTGAASPALPQDVDLALADAFLAIQLAEHESAHFHRGNAALWTGEAIFGVLSLVTRDFAPIADRLDCATARLAATGAFLAAAQATVVSRHPDWDARARRECAAAATLFEAALPGWVADLDVSGKLRSDFTRASIAAAAAYRRFEAWLDTDTRALPSAGGPGVLWAGANDKHSKDRLIQLLLKRGHWVSTSPEALLSDARAALDDATARLEMLARPHGGWPAVQVSLAGLHPTVEGYLPRFQEIWDACRNAAESHDLVTWPDAPIRFVPIPPHTRAAAPHLYYLFYRAPAAFDRTAVYDYLVPPIDAGLPTAVQDERLRATNDSVIKLNHVVHHGAIGHHVQNHHAYSGRSRIGRVAAIDAASRIGMFQAGSMAEGWACYVCDVMEDVGFLTPLESVSQQHTRVRLAARAVVDLAMHTGHMTIDDAARLYRDRAGMAEGPARAEAVKNGMFPGSAVMYWLGTRGLHTLRAEMSKREGAGFTLRHFHDQVLSHGSIPVALIAKLMTAEP